MITSFGAVDSLGNVVDINNVSISATYEHDDTYGNYVKATATLDTRKRDWNNRINLSLIVAGETVATFKSNKVLAIDTSASGVSTVKLDGDLIAVKKSWQVPLNLQRSATISNSLDTDGNMIESGTVETSPLIFATPNSELKYNVREGNGIFREVWHRVKSIDFDDEKVNFRTEQI